MAADVTAELPGAALEFLVMESSRLLLGLDLACAGDPSVRDGDVGGC